MKIFINEKEQKLSKSCLINIGGISYSVIMNAIKKKDVKVNGKRVNKDVLLNANDKVEVYLKDEKKEYYSTLFEDDNILVINNYDEVNKSLDNIRKELANLQNNYTNTQRNIDENAKLPSIENLCFDFGYDKGAYDGIITFSDWKFEVIE